MELAVFHPLHCTIITLVGGVCKGFPLGMIIKKYLFDKSYSFNMNLQIFELA